MKIKKIIAMLSASALCIVLTSCGKKIVNYTCDDYIDIDVSGVDGKGTAQVRADTQALLKRINIDVYGGEANDIELAKADVYINELVDYEVTGEKTNLSNGDKIVITLTADNETLSEIGIAFNELTYEYIVSGLEEPTPIDLCKDVVVTYEGVSPYLSAKAEYVGDNDFIRNNVQFMLENAYSYCANGDTVKVKASFNQAKFDEALYLAEGTEREFVVEGQREYAGADCDFTEVYDYLVKYAEDLFANDDEIYTVGWEKDARAFLEDGSAFELWKVTKSEISPQRVVLYTEDPEIDYWDKERNSYNIFWKIDMEIEKTGTRMGYRDTGYSVGDTEKSVIYFCTYANGIIREPDGTLTFDEENVGTVTYSTSFTSNYVGADLETVIAARDDKKSLYVHNDID